MYGSSEVFRGAVASQDLSLANCRFPQNSTLNPESRNTPTVSKKNCHSLPVPDLAISMPIQRTARKHCRSLDEQT